MSSKFRPKSSGPSKLNAKSNPRKTYSQAVTVQAVHRKDQSIMVSDQTTPSTLTEIIDPEVIKMQQEEIISLRRNIHTLNEQVSSLQQSIHEQNFQAAQTTSTVSAIQETLQEQQVYQTSLGESMAELKNSNSSLKSDILTVLQLLSKMDSKLSSHSKI